MNYRVDSKETRFFNSIKTAREYAKSNFPAVILKRVPDSDDIVWREIERFDRFYNEEKKEWTVGFFS